MRIVLHTYSCCVVSSDISNMFYIPLKKYFKKIIKK